MSKDTKEEVKKQIVDEIDVEIVDELKKELRDEVKEDRKARIKSEIENEIEGVNVDNNKEPIKEKTSYDDTEQINELHNEIKKIKENISGIDRCCENNKNLISVLIGVIGFLYAIGGAMYLYHIVHVESYVLGVYGLVLVVIAVALLWIQCELRECSK